MGYQKGDKSQSRRSMPEKAPYGVPKGGQILGEEGFFEGEVAEELGAGFGDEDLLF